MKIARKSLRITTKAHTEFLDITERIRECLARPGIRDGQLTVSSLHTTVALFINEFQEALLEDFRTLLGALVQERNGYHHDDPRFSDCERGNAHSHLRALFLGGSVTVPVADGEPVLGRWQRIILAELDGPRERKIQVQIMGV